MRQLEEHAVIAAFLNQVCKHVRAKELHADIREELSSHVADRMEILLEKGMPEEEAAAEAVRQMGDPNEIGRNLHRAHKPAVEWKILVIIAVMALIGIFGVFTVQQSGMYSIRRCAFREKSTVYPYGHGLPDGLLFCRLPKNTKTLRNAVLRDVTSDVVYFI